MEMQTANKTEQSEQQALPLKERIVALTEQLQLENQHIAQLMERQRKLRRELLMAQEQSLAELRSMDV